MFYVHLSLIKPYKLYKLWCTTKTPESSLL